MEKQAISPATLKYIARILGGAAAGGAFGGYVTPHISGYSDVPQARRVSAYSDALLGAILGGLGGPGKSIAQGFKALPTKLRLAIPTGAAIAELPPLTVAKLTKERQTADQLRQAAQSMAQSTIPSALGRAAKSPTVRGAGIGAAGAGILGLLSGLTRRKTESELARRSGRGGMVAKDTLKYLIPAMLAGGIAGSLKKQE